MVDRSMTTILLPKNISPNVILKYLQVIDTRICRKWLPQKQEEQCIKAYRNKRKFHKEHHNISENKHKNQQQD